MNSYVIPAVHSVSNPGAGDGCGASHGLRRAPRPWERSDGGAFLLLHCALATAAAAQKEDAQKEDPPEGTGSGGLELEFLASQLPALAALCELQHFREAPQVHICTRLLLAAVPSAMPCVVLLCDPVPLLLLPACVLYCAVPSAMYALCLDCRQS